MLRVILVFEYSNNVAVICRFIAVFDITDCVVPVLLNIRALYIRYYRDLVPRIFEFTTNQHYLISNIAISLPNSFPQPPYIQIYENRISNMAMLSPYLIFQILSKIDFTGLIFELTSTGLLFLLGTQRLPNP